MGRTIGLLDSYVVCLHRIDNSEWNEWAKSCCFIAANSIHYSFLFSTDFDLEWRRWWPSQIRCNAVAAMCVLTFLIGILIFTHVRARARLARIIHGFFFSSSVFSQLCARWWLASGHTKNHLFVSSHVPIASTYRAQVLDSCQIKNRFYFILVGRYQLSMVVPHSIATFSPNW